MIRDTDWEKYFFSPETYAAIEDYVSIDDVKTALNKLCTDRGFMDYADRWTHMSAYDTIDAFCHLSSNVIHPNCVAEIVPQDIDEELLFKFINGKEKI